MFFASVKVGSGPDTRRKIVQGETEEDIVEQIKNLWAGQFGFSDDVTLKTMSPMEFARKALLSGKIVEFHIPGMHGRRSITDPEYEELFSCRSFLSIAEEGDTLKMIEGELIGDAEADRSR